MLHQSMATSAWFNVRSSVALSVALVAALALAAAVEAQQDNCKVECYPNTKVINGKGGVGKGDNCRWILRTDGKAARLCDHIKCRKVCPSGGPSSTSGQEEAAASDQLRIEQQTEAESPAPAGGPQEAHGVMRHLHGSKLAKAPVPGVAGGRLAAGQQQQQSQGGQGAGRRMAPTMPPAVHYDENDTPPPISRFLDISPEE